MSQKTRLRKLQGQRQSEPPAGKTAPTTHKPWQIAAVCAVLVLVTVIAYSGVRNNDFVNFDDHGYVLENSHVQQGLTAHSLAWAFTTYDQSNWHPLTWIFHMLDWSLYSNNPPRPPSNQRVFARRQCRSAFSFAFLYDRAPEPLRNGCISLRSAPRARRIRRMDL
jgi:hypothetical protein